MQGFKAVTNNTTHHHTSHMYYNSSFFPRGGEAEEANRINSGRFGQLGELDQFPNIFQQNEAVDLARIGSSLNTSNISTLHFGPLNQNLLFTGEVPTNKSPAPATAPATVLASVENWRGPAMADTTQQTDKSSDVHTDHGNQCGGVQNVAAVVVHKPTEQSKRKFEDESVTYQTHKRLAQNREAARKSRIRKKAYVQELETSRLKLAQLEQELDKSRQQGVFATNGFAGDQGAVAFDLDYARWVDEHQTLTNELRSAISTHLPDEDLRVLVDGVMLHYTEFFRLKGMGSKSDIFHMLSGMWITPAERFFMWLGGFRSSELLKILVSHLEPLTDQQLMGFCNLQQSSQQAEDALSQGMEALQQSLVETLSTTSPAPEGSGIVDDYMGRMAVAMTKVATLENFVHQADLLRQQTLQQLQRILTTRQAARALLVIHDYTSRLRALSSLWFARPKN